MNFNVVVILVIFVVSTVIVDGICAMHVHYGGRSTLSADMTSAKSDSHGKSDKNNANRYKLTPTKWRKKVF